MGWFKKKFKQLGRRIKKTFKKFGKAFNKVFGGVFKKLGPIGSIALMFLLPGIGQMFSSGLSFIQGGASAMAGSTNAFVSTLGKIGEAIVGQAGSVGGRFAPAGTTSTLTGGSAAAGGVQWTGQAIAKRGLLGNIGAVHSTVTGALDHALRNIPGVGDAYEGMTNWLNKTRSEFGAKVSDRWKGATEANVLNPKELSEVQMQANIGPGMTEADIEFANEAKVKLDKHFKATRNLTYTGAEGTPFYKDSRWTINDPAGTFDSKGNIRQVSNFSSEALARESMTGPQFDAFKASLETPVANPVGTYGQTSIGAVGRSAFGKTGMYAATTIGSQALNYAIEGELADPISRRGQVVMGDPVAPAGATLSREFYPSYQAAGYQGANAFDQIYSSAFYGTGTPEFQYLYQQAYS